MSRYLTAVCQCYKDEKKMIGPMPFKDFIRVDSPYGYEEGDVELNERYFNENYRKIEWAVRHSRSEGRVPATIIIENVAWTSYENFKGEIISVKKAFEIIETDKDATVIEPINAGQLMCEIVRKWLWQGCVHSLRYIAQYQISHLIDYPYRGMRFIDVSTEIEKIKDSHEKWVLNKFKENHKRSKSYKIDKFNKLYGQFKSRYLKSRTLHQSSYLFFLEKALEFEADIIDEWTRVPKLKE